jgi:hypothetical protein
MQITPELLPRLIAILSNALWYAFLTGFVLMAIGVIASLVMPGGKPADAAKRHENTG